MDLMRFALFTASLFGATAVGFGAYHTHGMEKTLAARGLEREEVDYRLKVCDTGLRYQMFHALALLAIAALPASPALRWATPAAWLFVAGIGLFSGSLYAIALTGVRKWGAVTPLGGLLLILAWACLAATVWQRSAPTS